MARSPHPQLNNLRSQYLRDRLFAPCVFPARLTARRHLPAFPRVKVHIFCDGRFCPRALDHRTNRKRDRRQDDTRRPLGGRLLGEGCLLQHDEDDDDRRVRGL
jgi:hypothetical protein